MRLSAISNLAEINAFVPDFIDSYNKKLAAERSVGVRS
jgi:hypothetical protein